MGDVGQELRAVLSKNEDFLYVLRSSLTWDDDLFTGLETAIRATLTELEGSEHVPRWIAGFFSNYLNTVKGLAARSDIRVVRDGTDIADGAALVRDACARISDYQHWLEEGALSYGSSVADLPEI